MADDFLDLGTPLPLRKTIPDADYRAIRRILKAIADGGRYFAFCEADDSLIFHRGVNGRWYRDDVGSYFLELAGENATAREAELALEYFKKFCFSSHISAALKAKRLAQRKEGK